MIDWYVHGFETDRYAQELSDAIVATGNRVHLLQLPPFSAELPEPPSGPFVLYGGTRIIETAAATPGWDVGVWFNPKNTWSWNAMLWERHNMLMHSWHIVPVKYIENLSYTIADEVFVRPDRDLKEFAGEVMPFAELLAWKDRLLSIADEPGLLVTPDTNFIVGDVMEIAREWRVFMVADKPVGCSRYRSYGDFDSVREFPLEVESFIETASEYWMPAPVVVIDVGVTPEGRYGVIEANCFNSSGWYDVDINAVIAAVSEFQYAKRTSV